MTKTILSLLRNTHDAYIPDRHFGSNLDEVVIIVAIFIGQVENKPFSASKLSAYIDMPRPTLLRRLDQLERKGVVVRDGHFYFIAHNKVVANTTVRAARRASSIITEAAQKLSRMDN